MRLILDWLMDKLLLMEEWRYVSMGCGDQCVMMGGVSMMPELCVNN